MGHDLSRLEHQLETLNRRVTELNNVNLTKELLNIIHRPGWTTPAELGLTPRQGSVLALVLEGLPNKVIARRLGLTENTVKEHVSAILQRLGVRTRMQVMSRMERFRLRQ